MQHWPFSVVSSPDGKPLIRVEFKGEEKNFAPEEISAMVLVKMKETAAAFLGKDVKDAVVTVPGAIETLAQGSRARSHPSNSLLQRQPAAGDEGRGRHRGAERPAHHQ